MATITEDYVSFETAKLLKEKGFDESISTAYLCCDGKYWDKRFKEMSCDICQNEWYDAEDTVEFGHLLLAPTLQMAMKWLREVHHIHVCPEYKTFFQERPKKIYHHWCNKIIGIGRCFRQGIQDLNELDSEYFYHCGCKTCHDTFEEACEAAIKYCLENLI